MTPWFLEKGKVAKVIIAKESGEGFDSCWLNIQLSCHLTNILVTTTPARNQTSLVSIHRLRRDGGFGWHWGGLEPPTDGAVTAEALTDCTILAPNCHNAHIS
ncbi:hypothetical protein RB195_007273 [Necator americanus]|uniref:Uncharacterized protein n=1 Tax=Necator americanus TaxID=51031 RepID=A0ABR1C0B3_NECAM